MRRFLGIGVDALMSVRSNRKIKRVKKCRNERRHSYGANVDGTKSKRRTPHRFANDEARNCFGKSFLLRLSRSSKLKVVSNRAVESATLPELRRAHADAAAITDFVDFVEQVDDIEADSD